MASRARNALSATGSSSRSWITWTSGIGANAGHFDVEVDVRALAGPVA
jgi:hypothetical protein